MIRSTVIRAVRELVDRLITKDGQLDYATSLTLCGALVEWEKRHGLASRREFQLEIELALRDRGVTQKIMV